MTLRKLVPALFAATALAAILVVPLVSGAQSAGGVQLSAGFDPDPHILSGNSGGGIDGAAMGAGCRGWITPDPSHRMFLNTRFNFLRIFVRANGDTTLVVRGPMPAMTTQCNDDRFGVNPALEGAWAPGEYHIWVGSYAPGDMHAYQIGFTEHPTVN